MAEPHDFFRFLSDSLPEAILVLHTDGEITYFNPAAERLLGYSADEVRGQNVTRIVPVREDRRADPIKWLERWAADENDQASRFLDLLATTKSGEDIPLSVRVRKGAFDGHDHFLVTVRDVSEQRSREAEQRYAALRAMRILQIAEDAILSIDEDQKINFANLRAEELFGYAPGELLGKDLSVLLPDAARAKHPGLVEAFGKSKVPSKRMKGRGEITGITKSGAPVPLEAAITNVTVGGKTTYTAHLRDIREDD